MELNGGSWTCSEIETIDLPNIFVAGLNKAKQILRHEILNLEWLMVLISARAPRVRGSRGSTLGAPLVYCTHPIPRGCQSNPTFLHLHKPHHATTPSEDRNLQLSLSDAQLRIMILGCYISLRAILCLEKKISCTGSSCVSKLI